MSANQCPVCHSREIAIFIKIDGMPVYCNRLWSTREGALQASRGNIELGYCPNCGHVFNTAFNPDLMDYDKQYDNSLHYSPTFQKYAEALARRLVEEYEIYEKDVIELGCGKGDFLNMLCEYGRNRGLGFDPSYEADRDPDTRSDRFRVIQDYYGEAYKEYRADLICCRHVLEHVQSPRIFLESIRRTIIEQDHTIVFFEVPNVMYTIKDMGVWDLIYEHCGYFTARSLNYAFTACGFETLNLESVFEGQFLCIDAKRTKHGSGFSRSTDQTENCFSSMIDDFSNNYQSKKKKWKDVLDRMASAGKKTVIWGGGSKGVTFSNALNASKKIPYVVDINPHKQGKYIPGTGQKIVAPDFLQDYYPDLVLIMNPNYMPEIKSYCEKLRIQPEFQVV